VEKPVSKFAFQVRNLQRYITAVPSENRRRLEAFLHGCAGDDAVSLDTMLANPRVGAYLAVGRCRLNKVDP
jgi:hypothetical protein